MCEVDNKPVTQATFCVDQEGSSPRKVLEVDFNPESLHSTIRNVMNTDEGKPGVNGTQFVTNSVATLDMDLVFDSTEIGTDVRKKTDKLLNLLKPVGPNNEQVPPKVVFAWGLYSFTGIVTSYDETLNFFSHDGVPLRAGVKLTLTDNHLNFPGNQGKCLALADRSPPQLSLVANLGGAIDVAGALGNPRAARAIASLNGSASLRFDAGASLAVSGEATLSPPTTFASATANLSAGFGVEAGASLGGSIGGTLSVGGSIGVGGSLGIEATAGAAFGGLRVGTPACASDGAGLDASELFPSPSAGLDASAGFSLGGIAKAEAGASLASDVGIAADLNARMSFGD